MYHTSANHPNNMLRRLMRNTKNFIFTIDKFWLNQNYLQSQKGHSNNNLLLFSENRFFMKVFSIGYSAYISFTDENNSLQQSLSFLLFFSSLSFGCISLNSIIKKVKFSFLQAILDLMRAEVLVFLGQNFGTSSEFDVRMTARHKIYQNFLESYSVWSYTGLPHLMGKDLR